MLVLKLYFIFHVPPQIRSPVSIICRSFLSIHSVSPDKTINFFRRLAGGKRGNEAPRFTFQNADLCLRPLCEQSPYQPLLCVDLDNEIWGSSCSSEDFYAVRFSVAHPLGPATVDDINGPTSSPLPPSMAFAM